MTNLKSGLSGCNIELIDDDTLRKHSSNKDYDKRLLSQIKKQSLFSHHVYRNIDCPKVLRINEGETLSFDMEYVSGFSFDEYFTHAKVSDVDVVLDSMCGYFDQLIDNSRVYHENVSRDIFTKKLSSMPESDFRNYILELVNVEDLRVPHSFCHGDLTFANVIFHPKRLYFIDFLDSFIDSYLVDLAKIKQDLYYLWNLRVQGLDNLRLHQTYHYLWSKIEDRYADQLNTVSFKVLDAMNLLRIEPYLTDSSQRSILKTLVESTDLYEKFNCTSGGEV